MVTGDASDLVSCQAGSSRDWAQWQTCAPAAMASSAAQSRAEGRAVGLASGRADGRSKFGRESAAFMRV